VFELGGFIVKGEECRVGWGVGGWCGGGGEWVCGGGVGEAVFFWRGGGLAEMGISGHLSPKGEARRGRGALNCSRGEPLAKRWRWGAQPDPSASLRGVFSRFLNRGDAWAFESASRGRS